MQLLTFKYIFAAFVTCQMAASEMTRTAGEADGVKLDAGGGGSHDVPKELIHSVVMEDMGVKIMNHVADFNLTTATNVFTHYVQTLTTRLDTILKSLVSCCFIMN